VLIALLPLGTGCGNQEPSRAWSDDEQRILADLRLNGAPVADDPSNRYALNAEAAALGEQLFFDTRLSSTGEVSCASCHDPKLDHQDGRGLAKGVGTTTRRTMPLAGVASMAWFFWDGRKDSLWAQALGPLESQVEHGGDRMQYVHLLARSYKKQCEDVFGPLPDLQGLPEHAGPNASDERYDTWQNLPQSRRNAVTRAFVNLGKSIAAYETNFEHQRTRFDRYVDAVQHDDAATASTLLDADETAGLALFIGKAQCVRCHNGPHFSNGDFANTGVAPLAGLPLDSGRDLGLREALQDEFNCLSTYSDAKPDECRELKSGELERPHTEGAFKVPSLRNVAARAPYMHAGQLVTLEDVLEHYNRAPRAAVGETELQPLGLSARQRSQIVKFLRTLSASSETETSTNVESP
jgi:cytochrome c peroxidase